MKQINYEQKNEKVGDCKGILRIKDKLLYFKFNNNQYAQQMVAQMQERGAIITPGRGWIRVNIFGVIENVKLGNIEFNPQEKSEEEVELILYDFYLDHFTKAGFKCVGKDL